LVVVGANDVVGGAVVPDVDVGAKVVVGLGGAVVLVVVVCPDTSIYVLVDALGVITVR
jgi:hypothetical protein